MKDVLAWTLGIVVLLLLLALPGIVVLFVLMITPDLEGGAK